MSKVKAKFKYELSKEIYESTYKFGDETIESTLSRVARGLAVAEKEEDRERIREQFEDLLSDFKFIPGGRILSNAGAELKGTTLINCFVSGPHNGETDLDSMHFIHTAIGRQMHILKSEGGYGANFDFLRPRGAYIRGIAGTSPGAVTMMELWDKSSEVITSGAGKKYTGNKIAKGKIRKGAQMSTLSVWHPDIEEFITAKQTPGRLTKFNMSVLITDEFMEARKNNLPWNLEFPDLDHPKYSEEWDGFLSNWKAKGYGTVIYKTFDNANELWDLIMNSTYNRAEPGVLFIDTINRNNNLNYMEQINASNPCVTGDTEILTDDGYKRIDSLIGQKVHVWNGFEFSEVEPKITGYNKKIIKVSLSSGQSLKCTENHKFIILENGKEVRIQASDLKIGMKLMKSEYPVIEHGIDFANAYAQGFVSGDGSNNDEKNVFIYPPKYPCINRLGGKFHLLPDGDRGAVCLSFKPEKKSYIPFSWNLKSKLDWIAGLFDADGTVLNEGGIQLSSVDKDFLIQTQKLLTTMGVSSKVVLGDYEKTKQMPDGRGGSKEYLCKEWYRLCVGAQSVQFLKKLGMKCERLILNFEPNRDASRFTTIESLEDFGMEEKVYCFTEMKRHLGCFEGVVTGNCGEQVLPSNGGVCLLGSLNLTQFIRDDKLGFDLDKLSKYIPIAVRLMDNVNDISTVPLPVQKEMMVKKRRIGLGVLGYGSALMEMRMAYGSPEALKITEELMNHIANMAYQSSAKLAKEKGVFEFFDKNHYLTKSLFVQKLSSETRELIKECGLRNSHLLSIQPTGNTSIMANNVSGGLEPVFMPEYIRTSIVPIPPEGVLSPVVDWVGMRILNENKNGWKWVKEGDENLLIMNFNGDVYKFDKSRGLLKETLISDYGVMNLKESGLWDKSASFAKTTTELSVEDHIETMKIFAKYVDSAISKTVNIPNDYPFEKFKTVYVSAFENGIKGITTYRANTMTSVLSATSTANNISGDNLVIKETNAPKRPSELPAQIHKITSNGEKYVFLVGLLEGRPYEIFSFKEESCPFPDGFNAGVLRKDKAKGYQLSVGRWNLDGIVTLGKGDNKEALTRMASTSLRHGVPVRFLVDQLSKTGDDITSYSKAMGRVLKKYIDETKGIKCSACSSNNVTIQEGCFVCRDCGGSKCS